MRAVAVAAVLLYHSDVFWFPGGLLGVEVFFVLSGYLITALLLSELQARGRISFGTFLKRRARRLFPALFVMVAAVAAVFIAFLPGEVARIRGDVAAAATYTSNWYLIQTDHSYFIQFARPSPFGHLWSLAIEEQFYLLWPPVLVLLWVRVRRRRKIAATIVAGAALSVAGLAVLYGGGDPSRIYYGTDTRAAGLLMGAALAILWRPWAEASDPSRRPVPWVRPAVLDAATLLSGAFLVFAFMRFDDLSPLTYRPGLLLVALATALMIAACVHPNARLGRILGTTPMRWLGKRSYSVYLWYFPVFALTRPGVDLDISIGTALVLRTAITLTLAALSYRFVEEPIRNGTAGRRIRGLLERARMPDRQGRRADLAIRGAVLVSVTLSATLVLAMINAPPPTALATGSSSPVGLGRQGADPDPEEPAVTASGPMRVTALGDSVMSGARPQLRSRFGRIRIDAVVGRQVKDGIDRLENFRATKRLGDVVIVHLGNNGRFTSAQFERMMRVLSDVPHVVFVNVKVPRRWESAVNRVLTAGVRHHPEVVLVNWRHLWRACSGRVFVGDGTHLTAPGARCYARAIADAVRDASTPAPPPAPAAPVVPPSSNPLQQVPDVGGERVVTLFS
jgi:peptidoglycan/LPS O-acetylase OafA/YrhL